MPSFSIPCVALALALAAVGAQAQSNCESLRDTIEARIRGNGVADPVLTIVNANEEGPGRAVGMCERGAKKILYTRSGVPTTAAAPAAAPKAPAPDTIITECRDGRVLKGGSCS